MGFLQLVSVAGGFMSYQAALLTHGRGSQMGVGQSSLLQVVMSYQGALNAWQGLSGRFRTVVDERL